MKICMLETSPSGPVDIGSIGKRKQIIESDKCDFFFVTHNDFHPDGISFRKGERWASNRNFLASFAEAKEKYDYFWFTDYDVNYTSNTHLSVVEQIIEDLEEYNPAILVCFDPNKQHSHSHKNIYLPYDPSLPIRSALMTNNQMKIVHKSLIDYFFPMPLSFGSIWDTCLYFNLLEVPFIGHTAMTYNVYGSGMISEPQSQGNNASMKKMYESMKDIMHFAIRDTPQDTSTLYQVQSRFRKLLKNESDIDYFDKNKISKYIDLEKLNSLKEKG